jgi:1-deoxy-D-xylulose-5-phosphate synthase
MYGILSNIKSPDDLKGLNIKQMTLLAQDLRRKIVETVAETGGHLAPNLGVVELTIALHYVFDAPFDRIIWDVGHQAYSHKLLTGRMDRFHTLRQYGGISGFPKRAESPYDCIDTGHSSTSISAGLGMATALQYRKAKNHVIAVIGDGSMTAGMAFEALNNAGHLKKDLIVILNDNEMSISPNVGALSSFLSRKLTGKFASRIKRDMEGFLKRSDMGEQIWSLLKRSEDSLKALLTPGMLFEALQFEYIGPLPGHNLEVLIETFKNIKGIDGPVLVHVLTKKGRGYAPAEEHPEAFHGVGPFDIATGKPKAKSTSSPPSYTEIFGQTLVRLAGDDDRILAITAAMPSGTGLSAFAKAFPDRFFDVGISEQHAVTFAAGLALEGMRPVVAIYSTFLQRAYDQIIHDVCLSNLPVVFAIDRGGLVGDDGPTHHGAFDISFLRAVPNLTLMTPRDENELQSMLYTALQHNGPTAIRYPRGAGIGVSLDWRCTRLEHGRWEQIRHGSDLHILAAGPLSHTALQAADILIKQGVSASVINARYIKPMDTQMLRNLAQQQPRFLTVEENALMGGFGSAVMEALHDMDITAKVKRLGIPDRFIEHGSPARLKELIGLDCNSMVEAALQMVTS